MLAVRRHEGGAGGDNLLGRKVRLTAEQFQKDRRLAAIMFTDMVGYSALSQKNEALALELLNEHRAALRKLFTAYGGREIEAVGEGFFAECPSALAGCGKRKDLP